MELVDEVGTAIAYDDASDTYVVMDWNHSTGAHGVPMAVYVTGATEVTRLEGLTARTDGTLLTYIWYTTPNGLAQAIATLDRGTGELIPVIDVSTFTSDYRLAIVELATDPATGVDYALLSSVDGGRPAFMTLDVAGNTRGEPVSFGGSDFATASLGGADFTADGTLYFYLFRFGLETIDLATLGAPSTWPTANPTVIGPIADDEESIAFQALTTEDDVLANTGSELPIAAIALLGTVAVVAGGVTVMTVRRRSERGTV
jgi:hypothetical protein